MDDGSSGIAEWHAVGDTGDTGDMGGGGERGAEGRRIAPDAIWAAVRDDYLAGVSAPECCRRHGVGLTALRARAGREGWRRVDQPWIVPNRLDPHDEGVELEARVEGDLDRIELRELAYVARRRMLRAVLRGDAMEALRWRRVAEAMDAEDAEVQRLTAQEDGVADLLVAEARVRARTDVEPSHDAPPDPTASTASTASDGVFGADPPAPDDVFASSPVPDTFP